MSGVIIDWAPLQLHQLPVMDAVYWELISKVFLVVLFHVNSFTVLYKNDHFMIGKYKNKSMLISEDFCLFGYTITGIM